MRRVFVMLSVLLLMGLVHALDVNAIELNVSPTVVSDFNVNWDVNNANADWNHFIVSVVFGTVAQTDLDYTWNWSVGTDFNTPQVDINDTNYCAADPVDTNIFHCFTTVAIDGNFLRNGRLSVRIYGWKTDGNVFASPEQNVHFAGYSDINAVLSGYDSSGKLRVSVSFSCDVNAGASALKMGANAPSDVNDEGNTIVLTFTYPALPEFNDVLEVNVADVNADCNLPIDTRTVVAGLPNRYELFTPGWSSLVIPTEVDGNYQYTRDALDDFNVYIYYEGNGWALQQNPGSIFADGDYTLRAYVVNTDHNVVVPWRYLSTDPASCPADNQYITLSAGWSLVPVYCYDGSDTCSEYNSTLYGLSFLEFNTEIPRGIQRPFFSFIAEWNGFGNSPTPVYSFDSAPQVSNGAAYWVWVNPNWVQGGIVVHYYGRCVVPPGFPPG